MKNRSRFLSSAIALALASAALVPAAPTAQARPKAKPAPAAPDATTIAEAPKTVPVVASDPAVLAATAIGVVDEDMLADGYKKYKDSLTALDKRAGDLDTKMPAREFLNVEEGKEFDALIVKADATPAENTRINTLVAGGVAKRQEFMTLVGKAVRSEAEASRMKVLQDTMTGNQAQVRTLSESLLNNIRQQEDALDKQFAETANSVVGQVAAEKKLVVILRKRGLVWWSNTVDITNDVLTRLNQ